MLYLYAPPTLSFTTQLPCFAPFKGRTDVRGPPHGSPEGPRKEEMNCASPSPPHPRKKERLYGYVYIFLYGVGGRVRGQSNPRSVLRFRLPPPPSGSSWKALTPSPIIPTAPHLVSAASLHDWAAVARRPPDGPRKVLSGDFLFRFQFDFWISFVCICAIVFFCDH